jgi:hypothetical protein
MLHINSYITTANINISMAVWEFKVDLGGHEVINDGDL